MTYNQLIRVLQAFTDEGRDQEIKVIVEETDTAMDVPRGVEKLAYRMKGEGQLFLLLTS